MDVVWEQWCVCVSFWSNDMYLVLRHACSVFPDLPVQAYQEKLCVEIIKLELWLLDTTCARIESGRAKIVK